MTNIIAPGLLLQPMEESDIWDFVAAVRESVATVGRWMPWCHADYTEGDAAEWFSVCHAARAGGTGHEFAIVDANSGAFVGGAGLNHVNLQHRMCNLGYWVRQSRQREGVALRCVQALSQHAFDALDLHRVEIVTARGNEASAGVARKAGALWECEARNRLYLHGQPVSASVFSLVR